MSDIHATAIIEPGAELAPGVVVGPYSFVGSGVVLDENVRLLSHVVVSGRTNVGEGTTIYPFASIGHQPQDLKYKGEPSTLEIGCNNTIREHVTMNPGTEGGGMVTRVGDDCLFMVGSHVATMSSWLITPLWGGMWKLAILLFLAGCAGFISSCASGLTP